MRSPLKFIRKNLLAFAIVLAISLTANLAQPLRMDDATFLRTFTFHGHDLWAWAQEYWITWSGRVVPHGIFLLLLSFSVGLVDIMNGILTAFSLVLTCIWVFSGKEDDTRAESLILVFLAVCLYILTPTDILDVTIFWKTASVLYVWAFCAMLYALLPFTPVLSNAENEISAVSSEIRQKTRRDAAAIFDRDEDLCSKLRKIRQQTRKARKAFLGSNDPSGSVLDLLCGIRTKRKLLFCFRRNTHRTRISDRTFTSHTALCVFFMDPHYCRIFLLPLRSGKYGAVQGRSPVLVSELRSSRIYR